VAVRDAPDDGGDREDTHEDEGIGGRLAELAAQGQRAQQQHGAVAGIAHQHGEEEHEEGQEDDADVALAVAGQDAEHLEERGGGAGNPGRADQRGRLLVRVRIACHQCPARIARGRLERRYPLVGGVAGQPDDALGGTHAGLRGHEVADLRALADALAQGVGPVGHGRQRAVDLDVPVAGRGAAGLHGRERPAGERDALGLVAKLHRADGDAQRALLVIVQDMHKAALPGLWYGGGGCAEELYRESARGQHLRRGGVELAKALVALDLAVERGHLGLECLGFVGQCHHGLDRHRFPAAGRGGALWLTGLLFGGPGDKAQGLFGAAQVGFGPFWRSGASAGAAASMWSTPREWSDSSASSRSFARQRTIARCMGTIMRHLPLRLGRSGFWRFCRARRRRSVRR
jgi:hypothetical protein